MLERAQTAVVEICHSFGMRSLRRGRESARSDSNLLDLLDKSWFGPQQAGAADVDGTGAEAGSTYHVRPALHRAATQEPIAWACAATSPHGSTQPRPVSQCGQAGSRRGDESLAPSVFAMSISLDTVSPLSWASPPRQAPAPEPNRPTPRSTLTMQIQAEQLLAPQPDLSSAPAHGEQGDAEASCLDAAHSLAQDFTPDLVPDMFEGSEAINVHKDPVLRARSSFQGSATAAVAATLAQPRDLLSPASPSGFVARTSQSLIHPQQPQQQLSMPSISMPLLPILMAKPSAQQRPDAGAAAMPSLFPVAGSLGASLLFPIAAAAKSMRLRSMQGSESLQGTLECFAGGHVSTSAPLLQAPTLASPLGLEAALAAALGSAGAGAGGRAKLAEEQAQMQAQFLRNLRSSGLGQDASPTPGSCSGSAAAAAASAGPIGSDRINSFWRGLAAAAAAVDGTNGPTKAGPRGDQAETVIPWTSPMGNGATATADEGMCL